MRIRTIHPAARAPPRSACWRMLLIETAERIPFNRLQIESL
jgi:hypothetical protein